MNSLQKIGVLLLLTMVPLREELCAQFSSTALTASLHTLQPVGAFHGRFLSTTGGSLQLVGTGGGEPVWGVLFEYASFQNENRDRLQVSRTVTDGGVERIVQTSLNNLDLKYTIAGLAATLDYALYSIGPFEQRAGITFGVYRWEYSRTAYRDTIRVQGATGPILVDVLNVPASSQNDWSGGFSLGTQGLLRIASPLSLHFGARYKLIVGELWPALALDMQNVSTMQMIDLHIGVRADF